MGGYAAYVWSSFGLTFAVLVGNLWLARRRHAKIIERLGRQVQMASPDAQPGFKEIMT